MVNRNVSVLSYEHYVSIETLDYAYPVSLWKIEYELEGRGEKLKYARVWCNESGQVVISTKNPIPRATQEVIDNLVWGSVIFEVKSMKQVQSL